MLEDTLLVWQLKHGSAAALERVYERHVVRLTTVATSLLGDRAGAEDVVHDVFLSFAQSVDRLQVKGSLRAYLATCVLNRARDRLRSKARQAVPLEAAGEVQGKERRPEQTIATDETKERIGQALSRLPDAQREAVVMRLQGDMSFRRIAEAQSVSINTVQSQYRYGLQKLRRLLNGELES